MQITYIRSGIISSLVLLFGTTVFGQSFGWAKQIGGTGWDEVTVIATDHNKDIYTIGLFSETVDFDPGAGVFNLTSVGEKDAFICKLDAAGNFLWAKQYGDSAFIDEKSAFGIDAFDNLYITGSFLGTVDFDPGSGSFSLTSQGMDRDVFILKLDLNGNFVWAKQIGGPFVPTFPTPAHSSAIAIDNSGDLYITGYFDGTVDFDPHPSFEFNMTSQFNASDIFVCKLDTDGNFVWAKQFTGTQSNGGVGYALAVDESGNVYSTGTIGGTMDFDPGPAVFYLSASVSNQTEMYVSKLDSFGNFLWANTMGPGEGSALILDGSGHAYSSGYSAAGFLPKINKLDTAGNVLWSKQLGGINGKSIAVDSSSNVYIAGACFGTNDFDPGPGVFNLTGGMSDAYICQLDSSGNFLWAGLLTGNNQVWLNSLAIDADNNLYSAGYFNGIADFDPSASVYNLSGSAMDYDMFIQKLSLEDVLGIQQNNFNGNIKVYPNPSEGNFTVELDSKYEAMDLVLTNVTGQKIAPSFTRSGNRIELQIQGESGIYFLEITARDNHKAILKIRKK